MTSITEKTQKTLRDPQLIERIQQLRKVDNLRNLLAVARTWVFLAAVIGTAIAFDQSRMQQGWHWTWDIPVFALAIICVGAGQHQLTALAHEASHHVLLTNRLANEIVSDWFCMHPLFTTTHHYRLQHLAHHQFVNDPELDPNIGQFQINGHWRRFPITRIEFWRQLAGSLVPWNLLRFIRTTAAHNALGHDKNPYQKATGKEARIARRAGVVYFVALCAVMGGLTAVGNMTLLLEIIAGMWLAAMMFFALIPDRWYSSSRIHAAISMRCISLARITVLTAMFTAVAILSLKFGRVVFVYFALLWLLPLATSFSFFMMMRQILQHGNGDRGWLTNTRVMLVNRIIRGSVLPFGQDYHLPHHMYATVPHYHLKALHETLMAYQEYRDAALIVEGAVMPKPGNEHPTLVDMLGPQYSPATRHAAFIDNSVLDDVVVEEKDEILQAGERSRNVV